MELDRQFLLQTRIQSRFGLLARENKKFLFSLAKHGARAREYENALTWLENSGLVRRYSLALTPGIPLTATAVSSAFKVYALDVGLLGALADTPPSALSGDLSVVGSHHGAFAENYAAQQLTALGVRSLHYWKSPSGDTKVDFLHQYAASVLPLKIKAGTNVQSRSLGIYTTRFTPPRSRSAPRCKISAATVWRPTFHPMLCPRSRGSSRWPGHPPRHAAFD